jgi:hypothetical protein
MILPWLRPASRSAWARAAVPDGFGAQGGDAIEVVFGRGADDGQSLGHRELDRDGADAAGRPG